ncbi:MAG: 1-(5-phosphoribosyl)-5-[(5-phosphoribosylamino)methylideneamino]imidazole-4-carboxamide isomerase [Methylacidiphilales bacterium]|nr:1-(5-phosphoribosyl)-5-[(5-phosphoribosylamino)methylideneamino]imidazole-4-carboxamide isomerase [Candidatus Methylacidiphilales bacterium]MDW8348744.1 1-(5-phosphoribosyl)-5-[(5-phosphoribosylamino)methylideneamino]imidazole-4-carboxamide isomerase [Verrucomicrobiae bacterium]
MILFPAIDLLGGRVVRLQQGKRDRCTVYNQDPTDQALRWKKAGANWLHIVDLDGAFTGQLCNLQHVQAIVTTTGLSVQLGGGIRCMEALDQVFETGVKRAILGTRATESLDFVQSAIKRHGAEKIVVGIDARDGYVAIQGWTQMSRWDAIEFAKTLAQIGVQTIIYTDISTDGMFTGPNLSALKKLIDQTPLQIIASGGIASIEDLKRLQGLQALYGAIIGKALYEHKINLSEALALIASPASLDDQN